jgi:hypothetical protein
VADILRVPAVAANAVEITFLVWAIAFDKDDRTRPVLFHQHSGRRFAALKTERETDRRDWRVLDQLGIDYLRRGNDRHRVRILRHHHYTDTKSQHQCPGKDCGAYGAICLALGKLWRRARAGCDENNVTPIERLAQTASSQRTQGLAMMRTADGIHRNDISGRKSAGQRANLDRHQAVKALSNDLVFQ